MISSTIQTTSETIRRNEPDFNILFCTINNIDEGMSILKAIRGNKYITQCSIGVDSKSPDIRVLCMIRQAIVFKTEENQFGKNAIIEKFKFWGEMEMIRSSHFKTDSLSQQIKPE